MYNFKEYFLKPVLFTFIIILNLLLIGLLNLYIAIIYSPSATIISIPISLVIIVGIANYSVSILM